MRQMYGKAHSAKIMRLASKSVDCFCMRKGGKLYLGDSMEKG